MSRRSLFGIMAGGTALWWLALRGSFPLAAVDKDKNVAILKTRGGNLVAATQDSAGRVFMFDRAGNLYYDTEDPRTGMYIVDVQGNVYNKYVDSLGEVNTVSVGNIADLKTITVDTIGGVPVEEWQRSIKGVRGGRVTGFVTPADPSDEFDRMPPNAPYSKTRRGQLWEPPAMLEDWEVDLQPKGGGFFGGKALDPATDPAGTVNSLQRGDK